jgi:hypothetical protein
MTAEAEDDLASRLARARKKQVEFGGDLAAFPGLRRGLGGGVRQTQSADQIDQRAAGPL